MYEQPQPARRIGPLLIVVLLVLGGVGGTMGYLVARQIMVNRAAGGTPSAAATRTPDTAVTTTPATVSPDPSDDATFCPALTVKAISDAGLNGDLTLLLYIEVTIPRGKARAWICRNREGTLYYQAHELSGAFDKADNGRNTILLGTGIKGDVVVDGDGFRATNPRSQPNGTDTIYRVSRVAFSIDPAGTKGTVTRAVTP